MTQPTDPSMFADIKNQIIVEENSPVNTSTKVESKKIARKNPPRPNKLDRNSIAKGMKVPFGTPDLFSGVAKRENRTFEAALGLRKKHLA